MTDIYAIKENPFSKVVLEQLPLTRDWLDETFDRHAYHCFPMTIANRIGWGISFPEDISFIWNGQIDATPNNVTVLSGHEFVNTFRGNGTITFKTGYKFKSDKNISLLTIPVPNQFVRGAQCISTIISTEVFIGSLEIAWRLLEPNIEITIPAGTPVAAILPFSTTTLQEHQMIITNPKNKTKEEIEYLQARASFTNERNSVGNWSHLYRDAIDHLGQSVGKHEDKSIKLQTINESMTI